MVVLGVCCYLPVGRAVRKPGFEGTAFCLSGFGGRLGLDVIIRQRVTVASANARGSNDGEPPQCVRYGLACQLGYPMHIVRASLETRLCF